MDEKLKEKVLGDVTQCGANLSARMEIAWNTEFANAVTFLPKNDDEETVLLRLDMLNIFLEFMFGTAAAIATTCAGSDEKLAENLAALVKDKIRHIRENPPGLKTEALIGSEKSLKTISGS